MPTFSTVIPAYNCENSIAETLRSIAAQTRKCEQVIVVDDGSKDNTGEVVQNHFPWVEYVKIENSGVSVARNTGFERATGDYIALCDGDDIWHPDKLKVIENCIVDNPEINFFFHDFYLFGEGVPVDKSAVSEGSRSIFPFFRETGLRYKDMMPGVKNFKPASEEFEAATLLTGNIFQRLILGNVILPSSIVISSKLLNSLGGFDPSFRKAEETEFFLRVAKYEDLGFVTLPLAGYRIGNGGLTSNLHDLLEHGMRALYKNCVDDQQIYEKYKDTVDLAIARRYSRMASVNLRNRQRTDAWRNIMNGLRFRLFEVNLWKIFIASLLPFFVLETLSGSGKKQ
ncbi:MAG: glycosyltransferase family 2 protein [Candidatus Thiodiazotropha sp.]